jgi:hypothetical protein
MVGTEHARTESGVGSVPRSRSRSNLPPLPPAVLDHLGQKLRAVYYETGERPKYVGDTALPLEFDPYLYRLYQKERASRVERAESAGLAAVAMALVVSAF